MSDEEAKVEDAPSDEEEEPQFSTTITLPSKSTSSICSTDGVAMEIESVDTEFGDIPNVSVGFEADVAEAFKTVLSTDKKFDNSEVVVEHSNNIDLASADGGYGTVTLRVGGSHHDKDVSELTAAAEPVAAEQHPNVDMDRIEQLGNDFSSIMKSLQDVEVGDNTNSITLVLGETGQAELDQDETNVADISGVKEPIADSTLDAANTVDTGYTSTLVLGQAGSDSYTITTQKSDEDLNAFASSVVTDALSDLSTKETYATRADELMIASSQAYANITADDDSISQERRDEEMPAIQEPLFESGKQMKPESAIETDDRAVHLSTTNQLGDLVTQNFEDGEAETDQAVVQQSTVLVSKSPPQADYGLETTITFDEESLPELADDSEANERRSSGHARKFATIDTPDVDVVLSSNEFDDDEEEEETISTAKVQERETNMELSDRSSHEEEEDEVASDHFPGYHFSNPTMDFDFNVMDDVPKASQVEAKASAEDDTTQQKEVKPDLSITDPPLLEPNVSLPTDEGGQSELLVNTDDKNSAQSSGIGGIDFLGEITSVESVEPQLLKDESSSNSQLFDFTISTNQSADVMPADEANSAADNRWVDPQSELFGEEKIGAVSSEDSLDVDNLVSITGTEQIIEMEGQQQQNDGYLLQSTQLDVEIPGKESEQMAYNIPTLSAAKVASTETHGSELLEPEASMLITDSHDLEEGTAVNTGLLDLELPLASRSIGSQDQHDLNQSIDVTVAPDPSTSTSVFSAKEAFDSESSLLNDDQQQNVYQESMVSPITVQQANATKEVEIDLVNSDGMAAETLQPNENFLTSGKELFPEDKVQAAEQSSHSMSFGVGLEDLSASSASAVNANVEYNLENAQLTISLDKKDVVMAASSPKMNLDDEAAANLPEVSDPGLKSFESINFDPFSHDKGENESYANDMPAVDSLLESHAVDGTADLIQSETGEIKKEEEGSDAISSDAFDADDVSALTESMANTSIVYDLETAQVNIATHKEVTDSLVGSTPDLDLSTGIAAHHPEVDAPLLTAFGDANLTQSGDVVIKPNKCKPTHLSNSEANNAVESLTDGAADSVQEKSSENSEDFVEPSKSVSSDSAINANVVYDFEDAQLTTTLHKADETISEPFPNMDLDLSAGVATNLPKHNEPELTSFANVNFEFSNTDNEGQDANDRNSEDTSAAEFPESHIMEGSKTFTKTPSDGIEKEGSSWVDTLDTQNSAQVNVAIHKEVTGLLVASTPDFDRSTEIAANFSEVDASLLTEFGNAHLTQSGDVVIEPEESEPTYSSSSGAYDAVENLTDGAADSVQEKSSESNDDILESSRSMPSDAALIANVVYDFETTQLTTTLHKADEAISEPFPNMDLDLSAGVATNLPKHDEPELTSFANINFEFSNTDNEGQDANDRNSEDTSAAEFPESHIMEGSKTFTKPPSDGIEKEGSSWVDTLDTQNSAQVNVATHKEVTGLLVASTPDFDRSTEIAANNSEVDASLLTEFGNAHLTQSGDVVIEPEESEPTYSSSSGAYDAVENLTDGAADSVQEKSSESNDDILESSRSMPSDAALIANVVYDFENTQLTTTSHEANEAISEPSANIDLNPSAGEAINFPKHDDPELTSFSISSTDEAEHGTNNLYSDNMPAAEFLESNTAQGTQGLTKPQPDDIEKGGMSDFEISSTDGVETISREPYLNNASGAEDDGMKEKDTAGSADSEDPTQLVTLEIKRQDFGLITGITSDPDDTSSPELLKSSDVVPGVENVDLGITAQKEVTESVITSSLNAELSAGAVMNPPQADKSIPDCVEGFPLEISAGKTPDDHEKDSVNTEESSIYFEDSNAKRNLVAERNASFDPESGSFNTLDSSGGYELKDSPTVRSTGSEDLFLTSDTNTEVHTFAGNVIQAEESNPLGANSEATKTDPWQSLVEDDEPSTLGKAAVDDVTALEIPSEFSMSIEDGIKPDTASPVEALRDATNPQNGALDVELISAADVARDFKEQRSGSIPSFISSESDVETNLISDLEEPDLDESSQTFSQQQETDKEKSDVDHAVSQQNLEINTPYVDISLNGSPLDFSGEEHAPPLLHDSEESNPSDVTKLQQFESVTKAEVEETTVAETQSSEDFPKEHDGDIATALHEVHGPSETVVKDHDQSIEGNNLTGFINREENTESAALEVSLADEINKVCDNDQHRQPDLTAPTHEGMEFVESVVEGNVGKQFSLDSTSDDEEIKEIGDVRTEFAEYSQSDTAKEQFSSSDAKQEPLERFEEDLSKHMSDHSAHNTQEMSLQEELMLAMQENEDPGSENSENETEQAAVQYLVSQSEPRFLEQGTKEVLQHSTNHPEADEVNSLAQESQEALVEEQKANKIFSVKISDGEEEDDLAAVEETFEIVSVANLNSEVSAVVMEEPSQTEHSHEVHSSEMVEKKPDEDDAPSIHDSVKDVVVESMIVADQSTEVESAGFSLSGSDTGSAPGIQQQNAADKQTSGEHQEEPGPEEHMLTDTTHSFDISGHEGAESEVSLPKPDYEDQPEAISDTATNVPNSSAFHDEDMDQRQETFITSQLQPLNDSEEPHSNLETWQSQEELSIDMEAELISPDAEGSSRARAWSESSTEEVTEKGGKESGLDQKDETSGSVETEDKRVLHAGSGMLETDPSSGDVTVFIEDTSFDGDEVVTNIYQAETPIARSSTAERATPDSLDLLANKLDELPTPSIDTKDIELPSSMLNAMIDTPEQEAAPVRLELSRQADQMAEHTTFTNSATGETTEPHASLPVGEPGASQTAADVKEVTIDGQILQLNMSLISQYKDVFSHGGYTDEAQKQAIIVLSACEFPDRKSPNYTQLMDQLFLYVYHSVKELDAEEYAVIYLQGAARKSQQPALKWMKHCHDRLSRSVRKGIKSLYIVHPTFWTRTVIFWSKPFISSKFSRKIHQAHTLERLNKYISLQDVPIPDKVRVYDTRHQK